jgi:thiol-disulfide isomerase/thioredoxin
VFNATFEVMKFVINSCIILILSGCSGSVENNSNNVINSSTPPIYKNIIEQKIVDFSGYKEAVQKNDDVLYVVNFWATWCVPCVKELPHFIALNEKYKDQRFNMTFVTLDAAKDFESRVIPFVEEKKMNADLLLLSDVKNMNTWIKEVNINWSGAIPATIFYKNGKALYFTEGQLSKTELEILINKYL